MPGVYYRCSTVALDHMVARLAAAMLRALALPAAQREALSSEALARRFPVEAMMSE
jgi:hypothetical protein